MKTLASVVLLSLSFCALTPARANDIALYSGTCRNLTAQLDGNLKILVVEKGDAIEGYISISGWLTGSGTIKGTRDGKTLRFQSNDTVWGLAIDWKGTVIDGKLSGEYWIEAQPAASLPRQVGEWKADFLSTQTEGEVPSERSFKQMFMMYVESELNDPVKQSDGTTLTGAQSLFNAFHPIGTGVSVCVEDVEFEWKPDTKHTSADDIHRFTVKYALYWHGIIQANGWTRAKLVFNSELNAVTAHEVIESTGTTRKQANDLAFGIGFILGKAAVDSMLKSK